MIDAEEIFSLGLFTECFPALNWGLLSAISFSIHTIRQHVGSHARAWNPNWLIQPNHNHSLIKNKCNCYWMIWLRKKKKITTKSCGLHTFDHRRFIFFVWVVVGDTIDVEALSNLSYRYAVFFSSFKPELINTNCRLLFNIFSVEVDLGQWIYVSKLLARIRNW